MPENRTSGGYGGGLIFPDKNAIGNQQHVETFRVCTSHKPNPPKGLVIFLAWRKPFLFSMGRKRNQNDPLSGSGFGLTPPQKRSP